MCRKRQLILCHPIYLFQILLTQAKVLSLVDQYHLILAPSTLRLWIELWRIVNLDMALSINGLWMISLFLHLQDIN